MPIRMEKDSPQEQRGGQNGGKKRTNFGPVLKFLPLLILFLFKRPKLLIPVLIIGAVFYFIGGFDWLAGGVEDGSGQDENFFFGATLDQQRYDKAEVFEPLAAAYGSYNRMPAKVSLEQFAPRRMHQGRQGSCVGWASAYAARTILQSSATGVDPNRNAFSPSFLYNQIALQGCQGAYMLDAMQKMKQVGAVPFTQFRYDESSCSDRPGVSLQRVAQQFRIKGFNRLTMDHNRYEPDINGIRQHLAQGAPVVIGMQVGGSFMHAMRGQRSWNPSRRDYSLAGFSGHAMCVIGYDDNYEGGAFQIMNSWGEDWGDNGIAWVRYKDFQHFVKEAYGLYPMGSGEKYDENKLSVEFGLIDNATQQPIPLFDKGDRIFRTVKPIQKGDKFKVLFANSIECYVYVFGQETDGSSYVLFPYTAKHSPYCGITGARLFPKDYSMKADELGNKDYIALVVSKKELKFEQLNQLMNQSRQPSYAGKLHQALNQVEMTDVRFSAGKTVAFEATTGDRFAVGMVLEIDKE
jgi:hypothetical protein